MNSPPPYVVRLQTPVPVIVHGPVTIHGQVTVRNQVPVTASAPIPVHLQNPDYVADAAAIVVALIALFALLVSIRQTRDAEKAASDATKERLLMEESVRLMRHQVEYLNRKARLRVTLTDGTTRLIPTYAEQFWSEEDDGYLEGQGTVRLPLVIHNDGDRSARDFILRLLTPTSTSLLARQHKNLALEGVVKVDGVNYQRHSCNVPFVPHGSSALAPSFDFLAPLDNSGKILWQAAHDDGTDPGEDQYDEIDYAMPSVMLDDG